MNPNDELPALPVDPVSPMVLPGASASVEAGQDVEALAAEAPVEQDAVPASPVAPAQELAQTLNAARDAAAFVAQIFADVAPTESNADAQANETADAEPSEAVFIPTPVPVGWPLAGAGPLQGQNSSWGWALLAWPWRAGACAAAPRSPWPTRARHRRNCFCCSGSCPGCVLSREPSGPLWLRAKA